MTTTGSYSNVTSDAVNQDESHDDVSLLAMSYLMYRIGKFIILFQRCPTCITCITRKKASTELSKEPERRQNGFGMIFYNILNTVNDVAFFRDTFQYFCALYFK